MSAAVVVMNMIDEFNRQNSKPAIEISLVPELYEALRREVAPGQEYFKFMGVLILEKK